MMKGKSCNTCVSRFICPNISTGVCDGWNNRQSFESLLSLCFYGRLSMEDIKKTLDFVETLQKGKQ